MKKEEIENDDCGAANWKVFFFFNLSDLKQAISNHLADEI